MDDDLKKRIQQAKAAGFTDEQINATIKAKQQQDANRMQTQQQPMQQQLMQTGMSVDDAVAPLPQPKKGFIQNVAEAIVKPAVDFGSMVGAAGESVLRLPKWQEMEKRSTEYQQKSNEIMQRAKKEPDKAKKLAILNEHDGLDQQYADILPGGETAEAATAPMKTMGEEDLKKFSTPGGAALEGAKRTVGAMSYVVPAGKAAEGAGLLLKVGQGVKTGAAVGAMTGFSQSDKEDLQGLATDTVAGGIEGGITGGVVNGAVGAAQNLKAAGDATRRGTSVAPVSKLDRFSDQQSLQQVVERYPELGHSGTGKFQNVEGVIDDLSNQVDDLYKGVTATYPAKTLGEKAQELAGTMQGADQTAFTRLYNRAIRKVYPNESDIPEQLTALDVNKIRRVFNREATAAYKATERGGVLSSPNQAVIELRDFTDDVLTDLAPDAVKSQVQGLNRDMSVLIKGIPEFKALAEQGVGLPVFGKIPGTQPVMRATQATRDVVGQGMQKVGEAAQALPGQVVPQIAKLGAIGTVADQDLGMDVNTATAGTPADATQTETGEEQPTFVSPDGQWQMMADGKAYSMDKQWVFDTAANDWVANPNAGAGGDDQNPEAPMSLAQYNTQLSALAGQNSTAAVRQYGLLEKERDYYYPKAKLGAGGGDSGTAQNVLGQLKQMYTTVQGQGLTAQEPGIMARAEGAIKGNVAAFTQDSSEAANYSDQSTAFMSLLARGLGEKGVLTDQDINRVKKALPKFSDTPEKARQGWITIEQILKEAQQKEATMTPNTNTSTGMDVESAIQY